MAKQRFKGALNSASLPMVSVLQTRTVVQPQLDINVRTPRNPNSPEGYTDYSIPQVLYCENAVPTGEGFQSVGYGTVIPEIPGSTLFDQAITLRDANENNFLLSPAGGINYIYRADVGTWVASTAVAAVPGSLITRAYVNGRTFVCYEGLGVYEYDSLAGTYNKQTLIGLTDAETRGIGSSSNYLLAFTVLEVHWSSLVDPLDFTPSLSTGAGFAIPQDVKARITAVLGTAGGFIVYTAKNAVAAVYTNNSRAPFSFKEVSNAGGISSYEQVTSEQSSGPQYAWTTGGLQKISIQGAESISAEVNDFIAGQLWEYYDKPTHALVQQYAANSEFAVKLAFISSRWLIISYRTTDSGNSYNYALVYDIILKRWGKLKLAHVDCFYYPYPVSSNPLSYTQLAPKGYDDLVGGYDDLVSKVTSDPLSKLSIGFLTESGEVKIAKMSYSKDDPHDAVVVFGKFQMVRASMITMQQMDIESVWPGTVLGTPEYAAYVIPSLDGYGLQPAQAMVKISTAPGRTRYAKRVTGLNLNVAVEGTFALTAYLLEVTLDGDR